MTNTLNPQLYIAISGLIGSGKSTLADKLGVAMGLPVFKEPVAANPYLAMFYEDMGKHSFAMQVYLLSERFQQQQRIVWSGTGAVQDRSIYEDSVFARMLADSGLMSDLDFQTYTSLFRAMTNFMQRPTFIVYLDVSPSEALQRIGMRGRSFETGITVEYLTSLHAAYEVFLRDISRTIPVMRVRYEQFVDIDSMVAAIKNFYDDLGSVKEWDPAKSTLASHA
jgi:deoxyadenosine kinase